MWAAALLALAVISLGRGATCRLPAFPAWCTLHGGGKHSGSWFARMIELLAAAPVLLVAPSCLVAAAGPVVSAPAGDPQLGLLNRIPQQRCFQSQHKVWCTLRQQHIAAHQPNHGPQPAASQGRQLRPYSAARLRSASTAALLYCAGLAALLAVCACLLFGRSVQVGLYVN